MAIDQSPLGRDTTYPSEYAPELLFPIARSLAREHLPTPLPVFYGVDIWTGYEVSWLDLSGKPRVAIAEFRIPCDSPCIIESKSFKLYLNSFNQSRFASMDEVIQRIAKDLGGAAGAEVSVAFFNPDEYLAACQIDGVCLDELPLENPVYHPDASLLQMRAAAPVEECLYSNLLKTNCPVTGQPDWASVVIHYRGQPIDHQSLLAYVVSFREHQDFHEHCVERIFADIMRVCRPAYLSVYARYTRRGGLDINPYRSSAPGQRPEPLRLFRQ